MRGQAHLIYYAMQQKTPSESRFRAVEAKPDNIELVHGSRSGEEGQWQFW